MNKKNRKQIPLSIYKEKQRNVAKRHIRKKKNKLGRERAERLKRNPTEAEMFLQEALIENRIDFVFQKTYINDKCFYIVDFAIRLNCKKTLIVEVDGAKHFTDEGRKMDRERTRKLKEHFGILLIRFPNYKVLSRIHSVIELIMKYDPVLLNVYVG